MKNSLACLALICAVFWQDVASAEEPQHLALELNKAESVAAGCRVTFRATNYFADKLEDVNVEVYLVEAKGIVIQSIQFPLGYVLAGKTRFAKFDIKGTTCVSIGGMFVNEFKSCKGATDMALQCRETLRITNLTAIKFSDGSQ